MRQDTPAFALQNEAETKEPRHVIAIEFDVESIYLTSHPGITGIPGVVIENVLQTPSSISQRIIPDEGRTEIGSFSFKLIDLESQFTEAIAERLADYMGLRDHRVRFYVGYANPGRVGEGGFGSGGFGSGGFGEGVEVSLPDAKFNEFQLFQTQDITGVKFKDGVYSIQCADITREARKEIFESKKTTLRASISATDTTIPVYVTAGFTPIQHGDSFSDAPGQFVGYLMIEDEIIRYTGKTLDTFTGCTRGAFNTKALQHIVDVNADADRRPKVKEMIYLEMPDPTMAYAILTGVLKYASGDYGLPDHWHLGIETDLVRLTDFTNIGEDLWDTSDDTSGFIPAFQELEKVDGKKFLESELYQLMGCYSHVYYNGQIGLKRMNPALIDAAGVVELNESNVVSWTDLNHDYGKLHNAIRVDWNYNGEEFTRTNLFIDETSVLTHGKAPLKTLKFKGLRGWRHSDAIIRAQIATFRDRYPSPPQTMSVTVLPSLNRLEVGDIVRVKLNNVRDFAGAMVPINRAFEIHKKSEDYSNGNVTLDLFGSTGRSSADVANGGTEAVLADEFYTSEGVNLAAVTTIVVTGGVGVIQPGTYTLNGNANMNSSLAVYYYDGDLSLASGATLNIHDNVQIRYKGFFTINGTINGVGNGKTGVADVSSINATPMGTAGYIGNSRGMDGVRIIQPFSGKYSTIYQVETRQARLTQGKFSSFPLLTLDVVENELLGLPNDLCGTSGGPGEKVLNDKDIEALGGTGGNSGAGLALIGRGLAFGASGSINLSGSNSAATSVVDAGPANAFPGAGGAGCPGSLLILLDGGDISVPDIGGKFLALTGSVPLNGNPIQRREKHTAQKTGVKPPYAGFVDAAVISGLDLSNACHRIQYIPAIESPQEDQYEKPLAPLLLAITGSIGANSIDVTTGYLLPNDAIEIYGSITNNRNDAILVARGDSDLISHHLDTGDNRYYWCRIRRVVEGPDIFSDWLPESPTDGLSSAPRTTDTDDIEPDAVTAVLATSANSTTITEVQHTPDGQAFNTLVTSLTYLPVVSGEVLVTVSGYADYIFDAGGVALDLQYSIQADSGYDAFQEQHWFNSDPASGGRYFQNITLTRRFPLTVGVARTFKFMAAKFQSADTVVLLNVEMRLEVIKR